jgi:hypothetical protein
MFMSMAVTMLVMVVAVTVTLVMMVVDVLVMFAVAVGHAVNMIVRMVMLVGAIRFIGTVDCERRAALQVDQLGPGIVGAAAGFTHYKPRISRIL